MDAPIHGIYHGDTRVVRGLTLDVSAGEVEWIHGEAPAAHSLRATALLRGLDGPGADPRVRLTRTRRVEAGRVSESFEIISARDVPIEGEIRLQLIPDATSMYDLKAGVAAPPELHPEVSQTSVRYARESLTVEWSAENFKFVREAGWIMAVGEFTLEPHTSTRMAVEVTATDGEAVITGSELRPDLDVTDLVRDAADDRLQRWLAQSATDLRALRMNTAAMPDQDFIAAGAPWFFTLFGRDSLWCARFLIPVDVDLAASTLRTLAYFQGRVVDETTGEQPGKIMHELRPSVLEIPAEGVSLPPLYYGTIDATPLWIITLYEAWKAGLASEQIHELLPALQAAMQWMDSHGDADGDGFLEYHDATGTGLANQGWKDSGDSIQWRSGELATGPIALSEVQAYAYQAALAGAELLEHFDETDGSAAAQHWRQWAESLRNAFRSSFWVSTPEGRYPAIALDAHKQPVDALSSNLGHLLGTGILDKSEAEHIAALLVSPTMSSGFGLRTLSTGAAGYWPLSYHGGSVWTHDTAIAVQGLAREGLHEQAKILAEGLVRAAVSFDYRVPELYAGDDAADVTTPAAYPASCRPQGWAAASAIAVAVALNSDSTIDSAPTPNSTPTHARVEIDESCPNG